MISGDAWASEKQQERKEMVTVSQRKICEENYFFRYCWMKVLRACEKWCLPM